MLLSLKIPNSYLNLRSINLEELYSYR